MKKVCFSISVLFVFLFSMSLTSCSIDDYLEVIPATLTNVTDGVDENGISYQLTSFKLNTPTEFTGYFYTQAYNNGEGREIFFATTSGEWFVIRQYQDAETEETMYAAFSCENRSDAEDVSPERFTAHIDRSSVEVIFTEFAGHKVKQIISLTK